MSWKTPQTFKISPPISVSSADPAVLMDAVYNWLTSGTAYANVNGSAVFGARSPGSGIAWNAVRQQVSSTTVCLRMEPGPDSTKPNQRVMLYGQATPSGSPSFTGSDANAANRMFAAHVRDVTNGDETGFNGYDNASPYTGKLWSLWCGTRTTATTDFVQIIEGKDAIAILMYTTATNNPLCIAIGGDVGDLWDSTANRQGIHTSGYNTALNGAFHVVGNNTDGSVFVNNNATAGRPRNIAYDAAEASRVFAMKIMIGGSTNPPVDTNLGAAGRYVRMEITCMEQTGNTVHYERLRGISICKDSPARVILADSAGASDWGVSVGDPLGIVVGASFGATNDALMFSCVD